MITYEQALDILESYGSPIGTTRVSLRDALGRVLSEPVISPHDLPYFDNSAVDGFGVILSDVQQASSESPVELKLAGTIPAGSYADWQLNPGQTVRILTGSPVPSGVEAVVMQEFTQAQNGHVRFLKGAKPGENIRRRGEELTCGGLVLEAGARLNPAGIGLLAALGYTTAPVYQLPRVSIVVSGNELVEPGKPLGPGQIYESNSWSLLGALASLGLEPVRISYAADAPDAMRPVMEQALAESDVVLTTGGVSVGDYDYVKDILAQLGVVQHFWGVAIKPGKPVFFGSRPASEQCNTQTLVFGLPGNPVSVLLTYYLFAKPVLLRMLGLKSVSPLIFNARLTRDLKKKPGRVEFVRGVLSGSPEGLRVEPVLGQGSHMLSGMAVSNCLVIFPREQDRLGSGDNVQVMLLDWMGDSR